MNTSVVKTNNKGHTETYFLNDVPSHNPRYFRDHGNYRTNKEDGSRTSWVNLAAFAPQFCYTVAAWPEQITGYHRCKNFNMVITQGNADKPMVSVKFYDHYHEILNQYMEIPFVQRARMYKYQPIFLLKSISVQYDKYSSSFDLCTIDQGATFFITIIGFTRTKRTTGKTKLYALSHIQGGLCINRSHINTINTA